MRDKPYLKKGGLVWVTLFAVIGVAMLRGTVPPSQDPGYNEPLSVIIGCIVAIIAIGIVALRVLPRKQVLAGRDLTIPSPKKLVAFGIASTMVVFGLMYPFAGAHQPLFLHGAWAYIPVAAGTALAVWVYRKVTAWSRAAQWNAGAALALVSGALVGHTLFGLIAAQLKVIDRIGLVAMLGITVWLLRRLYRKQVAAPAITQ